MLRTKKMIMLLVAIAIMIGMLAGMPLVVGADAASDAAIAKISTAAGAKGFPAQSDVKQILIATGAKNVDGRAAFVSAYETAITKEYAASALDTLTEIQDMIDKVNKQQAEKLIGADPMGVVTYVDLQYVGLKNLRKVNEKAYLDDLAKLGLAVRQNTDFKAVQTMIDFINGTVADVAIAAIKAEVVAKTGKNITIEDLQKAGVTGLVTGNLKAYQDAFDALEGKGEKAADINMIQAIITKANADQAALAQKDAWAKLKDAAANNIAIPKADLAVLLKDAGLKNIVDANMELYSTAIKDSTETAADGLTALQKIIDDVNTKATSESAKFITLLKALNTMAANRNASSLTVAMFTDAGIANVKAFNLEKSSQLKTSYVVAVEAASSNLFDVNKINDSIDNVNKLIKGVNDAEAAEAFVKIAAKEASAAIYLKAGVKSDVIVTANMDNYKGYLATKDAGAKNTAEKVENLLKETNAAVTAIKNNAGRNNSITIDQFKQAGADKVNDTAAKFLTAYQDLLRDTASVSSLKEIQAIIDKVNKDFQIAGILDDIVASTKSVPLTWTDKDLVDNLKVLGITGVADANAKLYIAALSSATEKGTVAKVQEIIKGVNDQLDAIEKVAKAAADSNAKGITVDILKAAINGVTPVVPVIDANIAEYREKIEKSTRNDFTNDDPAVVGASTAAEKISKMIDGINSTEKGKAITKLTGNDLSKADITIELLQKAGLVDVNAANLAYYKDAIGNAALLDRNSESELNDLVATANNSAVTALVNKLKMYINNKNASPLTIDDLKGLKITGYVDRFLPLYKAELEKGNGNIDTTKAETAFITAVQGKVTEILNAEVKKVKEAITSYAVNKNAGPLTIEDLELLGLKDLNKDNLAYYKEGIAAASSASVIADLPTIIMNANNQVGQNEALLKIMAYADKGDASAMTISELSAAGINTTSKYLSEYRKAVSAVTGTMINSKDKLQKLIDGVDARLSALDTIAQYNTGTLKIDTLKAAGVENLIEANLSAYMNKLSGAKADTVEKIQKLIDDANTEAVNKFIEIIKDYAKYTNANGLTKATLEGAGVKDVVEANIGEHKADGASTGYIKAIEAVTAADVDTTAKIQALVDKVNALRATAEITKINIGKAPEIIPVGSMDALYPAPVNVEISDTVTKFLVSDIEVSEGAKALAFLNSDFATGAVGTDGATLKTDEATTIYVKVVSEGGSTSKYYALVFGKDSEAPVVKVDGDVVVNNGSTNAAEVKITITDASKVTVTVTKYGAAYSWPTDGIFTENGNYTVTAVDAEGNKTVFNFKIDRLAPNIYLYNQNNIMLGNAAHVTKGTVVISDQSAYTVEVYNGTKKIAFPANGVFTAEGSYQIIATDSLGQVRKLAFVVDTIFPVVKLIGVTAGGATRGNVTVTGTDYNGVTFTAYKYGKQIAWPTAGVFKENGNYAVYGRDKAGNVTKVVFTIDFVAPNVSVVTASGKATVKITDQLAYTVTVKRGSTSVSFPANGVFTTKGNYTLTATDALGNTRVVTFTVK